MAEFDTIMLVLQKDNTHTDTELEGRKTRYGDNFNIKDKI